MDLAVKMIAVVQGASSRTIQDIFRGLVDRWRTSARVVGVIAESHGLADRACSAGFLRNISTDELFPIFQDLGPGSTVCHLDGGGMLPATQAVQRDIVTGCDLVLLSKFGKLEADKAGLMDAFRMAIETDIPVLTSVSPACEAAWAKFAATLFVTLPADPVKIETWWQAVRARRSQDASLQSSLVSIAPEHPSEGQKVMAAHSFRPITPRGDQVRH